MERASAEVVLLLGSNLGNREEHLRNGVAALSAMVTVKRVSGIYESEPFGEAAQPWFLNLALLGSTGLAPHELLRFVKSVERAEGRSDDGVRWGPRTLDVDIILMGSIVLRDPDLTIPHAGMAGRRFCLLPLSEIALDFPVPPEGLTVRELLENCKDTLEVFPQ